MTIRLQLQWISKGKVIDLTKFKDQKLAYGGAVKTDAQKEVEQIELMYDSDDHEELLDLDELLKESN